jgi:hypothetical protein
MSKQIATAVIDANRRKEELQVGVKIGEVTGVALPAPLADEGWQPALPPPRRCSRTWTGRRASLTPPATSIGVAGPDRIPRGCVVNFTCHGTTGWGAGYASADWIGYFRQCLKGVFGEDFGVVFLQGACGDVTQVDNTAADDYVQSGPIAARRVGGSVAGETLKQLVQMRFAEKMQVGGQARASSELEPRVPTEEQLRWAREHAADQRDQHEPLGHRRDLVARVAEPREDQRG